MTRTLTVRLDSDGDVLLMGPAIRALAATSSGLDLLVSPAGEQAANLLPGVDRVLVFAAPWTGYQPPPVDAPAVDALVRTLAEPGYDRAVIFTSFHQSPLPMALLVRLAGIGWAGADCVDYPGSLLDLRHQRAEGHEVEAALALATAAGGRLPAGDDGRLAVCSPLPDVSRLVPTEPYVVVHPSAAVPARSLRADHAGAIVADLASSGWPVVVTGGPADAELCGFVSRDSARDLAGRTTLAELAGVLAGASCVVAVNTGPAHLAAAVGTPVVCLFAPVVPASRWAPYGVPLVLLGDQDAACRDSRARECPLPGHPCLGTVAPAAVTDAVAALTGGVRTPAFAAAEHPGGLR
ncbi:MAG TPA: glycosyltransferase family 9 protein [Nocardioidaceae bacterium]|nr:glycosyltransferase family 9 protein [Nocardioidaceae bacterium]